MYFIYKALSIYNSLALKSLKQVHWVISQPVVGLINHLKSFSWIITANETRSSLDRDHRSFNP